MIRYWLYLAPNRSYISQRARKLKIVQKTREKNQLFAKKKSYGQKSIFELGKV